MKNILIAMFLIATYSTLNAQVDKNSELYRTILQKDSILFNECFNHCDIGQLEQLVSENFEFYHDKGGITPNKTAFVESIKNGICKLNYKAIRKPVEGSMEVFPLEKNGILYGAIQIGRHRFFAIEKDKPEYFTSIARFTHVWLLEKGEWRLNRGLSYDHLDYEK